jgi:ribonuclease P protein component
MNTSSQPSFATIMKRGTLVHSPHLSLKVLKGEGPVFVVVSKKVAKTAVLRNRLKRRVRSIVQKNKLNGIFFTKKGATGLSFQELKKEVSSLVGKV